MKAWITLHAEGAEIGESSAPCAVCLGRTLLVPIAPGLTIQADPLAVERTHDPEVPVRIDVAPHDCARWRGEAREHTELLMILIRKALRAARRKAGVGAAAAEGGGA